MLVALNVTASDDFAIVLFAHGARDERWAEPFQRVAAGLKDRAPGLKVELAYLEFLHPNLGQVVEKLSKSGTARIRVVPLFFGRGGHLRNDVPRLLATLEAAHPETALELAGAAGDDSIVVEALVTFCLDQARHRVGS